MRKQYDCKEGLVDSKRMLSLVLDRLHIDKDDPSLEVTMHWKDIVGAKYAEHVKILDIRKDVLMLQSDHPSWSQLVSMDKQRILRVLNRDYPSLGIKRIVFVS